jgi:hypothetical protein
MLRRGLRLPPELPQSLDVQHIHESSPSAFPNGCHIAEVEIDPETGVVEVVKYSMVNDFGVIVNPLLVAGQVHGGVVQGIGEALMEQTVFDEEGQFLTGSFTDYALPRASDADDVPGRQPPGPCEDQSARRERMRRGRMRRILAGSDERRCRRALRIWHPPPRYAGELAPDMASNPTGAVAALARQPYPHLMVNGGIAYLDAGDIRDKSAAGFVPGCHDPRGQVLSRHRYFLDLGVGSAPKWRLRSKQCVEFVPIVRVPARQCRAIADNIFRGP